MLLGYNTNGFAHHDPESAVEVLAEIGYRAVALTIEHNLLNPYRTGLDEQIELLRSLAQRHSLRYVIETGGRFLLNPRVKHEPTLISPRQMDRSARIDFYLQAIRIAARLDAECVSLWSGVLRDNAIEDEAFATLTHGLAVVLDYAEQAGVAVAFEPEPGMLVDTLTRYDELKTRLREAGVSMTRLGLTIDIGHLHCQGETPIGTKIRQYSQELLNVHLDDARAGVHEHLQFGDGEIEIPSVMETLQHIGFAGVASVELSRHSHAAPDTAERAFGVLSPWFPSM